MEREDARAFDFAAWGVGGKGGGVEWEFLVAQPTKDEKRNLRRKTSDFSVFFKCERNSFCIV